MCCYEYLKRRMTISFEVSVCYSAVNTHRYGYVETISVFLIACHVMKLECWKVHYVYPDIIDIFFLFSCSNIYLKDCN